jgi:hypothetical protein
MFDPPPSQTLIRRSSRASSHSQSRTQRMTICSKTALTPAPDDADVYAYRGRRSGAGGFGDAHACPCPFPDESVPSVGCGVDGTTATGEASKLEVERRRVSRGVTVCAVLASLLAEKADPRLVMRRMRCASSLGVGDAAREVVAERLSGPWLVRPSIMEEEGVWKTVIPVRIVPTSAEFLLLERRDLWPLIEMAEPRPGRMTEVDGDTERKEKKEVVVEGVEGGLGCVGGGYAGTGVDEWIARSSSSAPAGRGMSSSMSARISCSPTSRPRSSFAPTMTAGNSGAPVSETGACWAKVGHQCRRDCSV